MEQLLLVISCDSPAGIGASLWTHELQCLAEKLVFCWLWKIWYSYVCNQNWKMIDTSLERPDSQLWSAVSKISKLLRLLSFRLNLIWAKIAQFSKLNNFVTDEYFFWNFVFKELSQMLWNAPGIFWFASKFWVSHHFCWKNTIFKIQPKTLLTLTFLKSLKIISKRTFRSFIQPWNSDYVRSPIYGVK